MDIAAKCEAAYLRHKNLKLAAADVGIPWQTVYVHLRKSGEPVTGDKLRYGSESDRLAARSERDFLNLVPAAEDMNRSKFQSKVDFMTKGYSVDLKASQLRPSNKRAKTQRWAFSVKKQEFMADFFVCFAYQDDDIKHCFLIPGEIARFMATVSISESGKSKWMDYEVAKEALAEFFGALDVKQQRPPLQIGDR